MAMSTKFMELNLDRNLLDYNFEGYKLSLEPTHTIKYELQTPLNRVLLEPNHNSYIHAKLFSLNNFLLGETTSTHESVFFIDAERNLIKASLNPYSNNLDVITVWSVPVNNVHDIVSDSDNTNYNISVQLVSKNMAVLCDGSKKVFILNTGDRSTDSLWQLDYVEELMNLQNFYIQDAVLKGLELHIILCTINQGDKKAQIVIYWVTFIYKNNSWEKSALRELLIKGDFSYLFLERNCEAIYISSSKGCKFTSDSVNPVTDELTQIASAESTKQGIKNSYKWNQDSNEVVIHFLLPQDVLKEDVIVTSGSTNILVEYKDICLLNGPMFDKVDLTTVTLSKNLLEITLVKRNQGIVWPSFLKEEKSKDLDSDELFISREIGDKLEHLTTEKEEYQQQGITFNTEQVEECDFENDEPTIFERLCVKTHKVTHKYNFGSNQVLLTVPLSDNCPPYLGIRNDVDICLWKPNYEDGCFELKHVGSLFALGYIQASKQQKKFIACPPDTSYSVICEVSRHIFLYRQRSNVTSGELKNRKSGAKVKSIAKQQVISIPNTEIYGIYASPTALYVLSESFLMCLKS